MILGMGPLELVIIAGIVLLIFGPKNLPKLGSTVGKTVKNIREGMDEDTKSSKDEATEAEVVDKDAE
ncbi:Sec-independent protein translocase subunit TatA/TatB [Atopobium fossor]|uniref:Sec-independent protein translocase subunit TatA/TatB n=1 Tax=Atopobium fossor TaxID=39487 RepID=UPI000407A505|nr:twin-arginine translocase TatA/TatE family subunit [Atopobium fossor]